MRASDPQQRRVYALERAFTGAWLDVNQPLKDLQKLSDKACRRWGVKPLPVRLGNSTSSAGIYYDSPSPSITLLKVYQDKKHTKLRCTGRNACVLLHEVAHHIESTLYGEATHGSKWVAVVMDLYHHYRILPDWAFRKLAKKHRVKIARL